MKYLVVGCNGQLGAELRIQFKDSADYADIEQLDINAPIPRRLAALCLWLAAQVLNESGCATSSKGAGAYVTDISGCSASERKAIAYLYESGILNGYQVKGQMFYPEAGLKTEAGNSWLLAVKQRWK